MVLKTVLLILILGCIFDCREAMVDMEVMQRMALLNNRHHPLSRRQHMVAMGRATHLRYFLLHMLLAMLLAGSGKCSVYSIGYCTGHFVNSVWLA